MRTQALSTIGALYGLVTMASAIPAGPYSRVVEPCGRVMTIYVTVAPTEISTVLAHPVEASLVSYGGLVNPKPATTAQSEFSVIRSSSKMDLTSTLHLTSTVRNTVFLSQTVIGPGTTITETIGVTYPTSSPLPAGYTLPTSTGGIGSTSSVDALRASSPSMTTAQAIAAASGNYMYPIVTIKVPPTCSDDLVTCPETSVSNSLSSFSAEDVTISQTTESTSVPPEVYVVETLTVIPLATLPTVSSSTDKTKTLTLQITTLSDMNVTLIDLPASTPTKSSYVYAAGPSGTASSTSAIDALQSAIMAHNVTSSFSTMSLTASTLAQTTSEATWTESCSEDSSVKSAMNATQPTVMSTTRVSSFSSSSTSYSLPLSFLNSTTMSGYTSLTAFSTTSNFTSQASSAQTTFSDFSTSTLSPVSLQTSRASSFALSMVPSSASTSTTTSTTTTTSSSNTSLYPSSAPHTSAISDTTRTKSITPNSSNLTFTTLISIASTSTSSPTALSATKASSTNSLLPKPKVCGEHGAFTLNFDDLPPLSVSNNSTAQPMPLFSPYHQFYFSEGFTIVPPPTDPYLPSSGRLLVEFLADNSSALGYRGALGNGETALLGCFNFNALGMSLGCDSTGPNCDWQFTGLRYNNVTKATDTITTQSISTAACTSLSNCALVPIFLDSTFKNLTELRIHVSVAGKDKIWWMDDLNLFWFDNSCDAGLCRQEHV